MSLGLRPESGTQSCEGRHGNPCRYGRGFLGAAQNVEFQRARLDLLPPVLQQQEQGVAVRVGSVPGITPSNRHAKHSTTDGACFAAHAHARARYNMSYLKLGPRTSRVVE